MSNTSAALSAWVFNWLALALAALAFPFKRFTRCSAALVTVLRRGVVREVSLVTLGADPNAVARLFGQRVKGTTSLDPRSVLARRAREAAGYGR